MGCGSMDKNMCIDSPKRACRLDFNRGDVPILTIRRLIEILPGSGFIRKYESRGMGLRADNEADPVATGRMGGKPAGDGKFP